MPNERELIAKLGQIFGKAPKQVLCGIGDDTAVFWPDEEYILLWTIDSLIEGVHFDLSHTSLKLLGRKALAVNLSDIAAMGGEPQYALLALGWPPQRDLQGALELAAGMQEMAREYGTVLIGGDTVGSPQGLTISLTVLGRVKPTELLRRNGAKAGDLIYVTGPLGQAAAGLELLRHKLELPEEDKNLVLQSFLDPQPEVVAGRLLARHQLATSLIDLSDGVASDLYQICLSSQTGAVVEAERVPITEAVKMVAALTAQDPLDLALKGGEDYRLLFTSAPDKKTEVKKCFAQANLPEPCCIGRIISGKEVRLRSASREVEISGTGFDHFPSGASRIG
jgi:thiamine-monophosphate kinase